MPHFDGTKMRMLRAVVGLSIPFIAVSLLRRLLLLLFVVASAAAAAVGDKDALFLHGAIPISKFPERLRHETSID